MLIPTHVDVLLPRRPYVNYVLIALSTVLSTVYILGYFPSDATRYFITGKGLNPLGMFLCVFLHLDFFHLIGNMVFQWVFGNAVCSKIGNWRYLLLYFAFTFAASACHSWFSSRGAIGASGAINGIIGFYFAMYPRNYIYVFYWFYITFWGHSRVPGYVLIIFWFIMDAWGALSGGGLVAYWAHLGGFAAGMVLAIVFLKLKWIQFHRIDQDHLFQRFFGRFNVDEITKEMSEACFLLQDTELSVRIGDMDEVKYPASILYRMMETGKVRGDDEVFDRRTGKWETFAGFFTKLSVSPEMVSKKNKAVEESLLPEEEYFIHKDGQNYGPYKVLDLKSYVANGEVSEDALMFEAKTNNWMKVRDVL